MRQLFTMIMEDGGEGLGFKKPMANQIVEYDMQLPTERMMTAELFTFDERKYAQREAKVQESTTVIGDAMKNVLDTNKEIYVECIFRHGNQHITSTPRSSRLHNC